jgi:rSAM/selenodomain-associated transferase 2
MSDHNQPACAISIVIPVLNEAANLPALISRLYVAAGRAQARDPQLALEVIIVDGGSTDATLAVARGQGVTVVSSAAGRGRQMNAGARQAHYGLLWFLHADSVVPPDFVEQLAAAWASGAAWGRFDIRFDSSQWRFGMLAWFMNWRSRVTGICTGDQGMFVQRELFNRLGGFAEIPLMEDIEISRRLRQHQPPRCVVGPLRTSARRWQQQGFVKTVLFMWSLRWRYFFGASPAALVARYYPAYRYPADSSQEVSNLAARKEDQHD